MYKYVLVVITASKMKLESVDAVCAVRSKEATVRYFWITHNYLDSLLGNH